MLSRLVCRVGTGIATTGLLLISDAYAVDPYPAGRKLKYLCQFEQSMVSDPPYLCGTNSGFEETDGKFQGSVLLTTPSLHGRFRFKVVVTSSLPVLSCGSIDPTATETLSAKIDIEKSALRVTTTQRNLMRLRRPVGKTTSASLYVTRGQLMQSGCSSCRFAIPGTCSRL